MSFLIYIILAGEVTSVYVRNLPPNVTEPEIDQEFKNFGKIKPDGIFIRVRKVSSSCFIKLNVYASNHGKKRNAKV